MPGAIQAGFGFGLYLCIELYSGFPRLGIHLLQLSACSWAPAAVLASQTHGHGPGASILFANLVHFLSIWVHRLHRGEAYERWDYVDGVAVLAWVGYNTVVTVQVIVIAATPWRPLAAPALLVATATLCALAFVVLNPPGLHRLPYRSYQRNALHVAMHVVGGLGTLLLLVALRASI